MHYDITMPQISKALVQYSYQNINLKKHWWQSRKISEYDIIHFLGALVPGLRTQGTYQTSDVNISNTKTILGNTALCRYDLNTYKLCYYYRHLLARIRFCNLVMLRRRGTRRRNLHWTLPQSKQITCIVTRALFGDYLWSMIPNEQLIHFIRESTNGGWAYACICARVCVREIEVRDSERKRRKWMRVNQSEME